MKIDLLFRILQIKLPSPSRRFFSNTIERKGIVQLMCIPFPQWTIFFEHDDKKDYGTINKYSLSRSGRFFKNAVGRRGMVQLLCIPVHPFQSEFSEKY